MLRKLELRKGGCGLNTNLSPLACELKFWGSTFNLNEGYSYAQTPPNAQKEDDLS
jgi:hypothetical protein